LRTLLPVHIDILEVGRISVPVPVLALTPRVNAMDCVNGSNRPYVGYSKYVGQVQ
jgi:hypothetical protein